MFFVPTVGGELYYVLSSIATDILFTESRKGRQTRHPGEHATMLGMSNSGSRVGDAVGCGPNDWFTLNHNQLGHPAC
jgi:hypothetical protein